MQNDFGDIMACLDEQCRVNPKVFMKCDLGLHRGGSHQPYFMNEIEIEFQKNKSLMEQLSINQYQDFEIRFDQIVKEAIMDFTNQMQQLKGKFQKTVKILINPIEEYQRSILLFRDQSNNIEMITQHYKQIQSLVTGQHKVENQLNNAIRDINEVEQRFHKFIKNIGNLQWEEVSKFLKNEQCNQEMKSYTKTNSTNGNNYKPAANEAQGLSETQVIQRENQQQYRKFTSVEKQFRPNESQFNRQRDQNRNYRIILDHEEQQRAQKYSKIFQEREEMRQNK